MTTPLSSSNLSGYDYNPGSRTLVIYFHGGRAYTYSQVPQDIADGLANAPSPGKYFNSSIKNVFEVQQGVVQSGGTEQHA